ncbi:MAG: PEP-CTERM sorting domain-containing protein [Planctomycetota bacterium]
MHKTLTLCLIGCLLWTACADHNGSLIATSNGPEAPINQPEDGLFPGDQSGNVNKNPNSGGEDDGSQGSGSTGSGSNGGGSNGGGDPGGGDPGGNGGGGNGSGGESGGGGGGQPVPEPSTLLLVGSGLAGAALLRRRRKSTD